MSTGNVAQEALRDEISSFLDGKSILLTGGSGFVGKSLLQLLKTLRFERDCKFQVTVLSRNPRAFRESHPDLAAGNEFISANIPDSVDLPTDLDCVIHAATPASAALTASDPETMFQINVQSMRWILTELRQSTKRPTLLFTSSGAAHGNPNPVNNLIDEKWAFDLRLPPKNIAYARGKRVAEEILLAAHTSGDVDAVVARLFTFSGRFLPLDSHFAIGNFVRDALNRGVVTVRGDGQSVRSYMDSDDMALWILASLRAPQCTFPLNIGSESAINIRSLAMLVSERVRAHGFSVEDVQILGKVSELDGLEVYVPSTRDTQHHIGATEWTPLKYSIDRMITSLIT